MIVFLVCYQPKNQMDELQAIIRQQNLVLFSKTYCPHCYKARQLFSSLGVDLMVIELDKVERGAELQQALAEPTGNPLVPKLWLAGLWFDAEGLCKFYSEGHLIPYLKSIGIQIIT